MPGIPNTAAPGAVMNLSEVVPYYEERNFTITGVTKDAAGAPLAGVTVKLFNTATDLVEQQTVSDASGNYSFVCDKTMRWYIVSYLAGSPDVAGTTRNDLVAA
jgi:hypothetical protein